MKSILFSIVAVGWISQQVSAWNNTPSPTYSPTSSPTSPPTPSPTPGLDPDFPTQPPAPIVIDGKLTDWFKIDDHYKLNKGWENYESAAQSDSASDDEYNDDTNDDTYDGGSDNDNEKEGRTLEWKEPDEPDSNTIEVHSIRFYNDDDNLYLAIKNRNILPSFNTGWKIGFDIDNKPRTGYRWYKSGIEFLIKGDKIYKYMPRVRKGKKRIWKFVGKVGKWWFHRRVIEILIPLKMIDIDITDMDMNSIGFLLEGDHSAYGEKGEPDVCPPSGRAATYRLRKGGSFHY